MENLAGSREEGGYAGTLWVKEILPNLLEGSLVVIFAEDESYGGTKASIGGNCENRQKIVFSGYISKDSISYDYRTSTTRFDVMSITNLMKEKEGLSISADDVTTPSKWQHLSGLNMKKALWYYLKWYSR